jgi:tRNA U34 5-methylaminomethyl-2-thiouridine-forming methyltransferase MnmC
MIHFFSPQLTKDGSFTFYSPEFEEAFHSDYGAKQEAIYKFVKPCLLAEKARGQNAITLLDICYGLGYNTAAAIATIWEVNPHCFIQLIALESDLRVPQAAIAQGLFVAESSQILTILEQLAHKQKCENHNIKACLMINDARIGIQKLRQQNLKADGIFLDPFSPPKCPQLWTVDFIQQVAACLKPDGRLATYSCASAVRSALAETGLYFGSSMAIGRKTPGTVASWNPDRIPALSQREQEHLKTIAANPYRDRTLQATAANIKQQRQVEQKQSDREPTKAWKKRWRNQ